MKRLVYHFKSAGGIKVFFTWCLGVVGICLCLLGCDESKNYPQQSPAEQASMAGTPPQSDRPNILLLVADDLGYSDLGSYGGEISTPRLDALARSGMLFTNFHTAPACTPTRSMLLTGVDHHLAGVGNMKVLMAQNQKGQPGYEGVLNNRVVSIARLLKDSGYHTYISGKWDLGADEGQWPSDRGFERTFALLEGSGNHFNDGAVVPLLTTHHVNDGREIPRPAGYSSDLYTDKLIEFMQQDRGDGKPFFAYAAYTAPHWPLQAPAEYIEKYKATYRAGWDKLRAQRLEKMKAMGLVSAALNLPPRWDGVPVWESLTPEQQQLEARKMAVYAAMVENMDHSIGRILDYLRDSGQLDNTLIVFMSDNGADAANIQRQLPGGMPSPLRWVYQSLVSLKFDNSLENLGQADSHFSYGLPWAQVSATPHFLHKGLVSEGGLRVPLIISYPAKFPASSRSNAITRVVDLAPTFLELAGVELPGKHYGGREVYPIEGRSLLPLLSGDSDKIYGDTDALGFEFVGSDALIQGDWKIIRINDYFLDGKWRLINLKNDPGELIDLSQQYPDRFVQMKQAFQQYQKEKGIIRLPGDYFDSWPGKGNI